MCELQFIYFNYILKTCEKYRLIEGLVQRSLFICYRSIHVCMLFRSREDRSMLIISLAITRLMRYRPARPNKLVLHSFEVMKDC